MASAKKKNSKENIDFLFESKKIGNEIIEKAIKEESGWYWKVHDHKGVERIEVNLYNGNSGVIFFLIELYKVTNEEKYLNAIIASLNWLLKYKYSDAEKNLAFYCGSGGVIYVMIEGYKITNNVAYKEHALELAKSCGPNTNSDILYGTAGSLLTLIYLHNETNENWILQEINKRVIILLNDAFIPEVGICWERSGAVIRPLCGFAHGASGIAFVFLELFRYFKNDFFYRIADMAFQYEDQYFEANKNTPNSKNNWPDFRKDIHTEENYQKLLQAFQNKNYNELTEPNYMSAWCHGAPGIGLARLHAYKITIKERYSKYLNCALANTLKLLKTPSGNQTLCHGGLGNASLFLETHIANNNKNCFYIARQAAIDSLLDKKQNKIYVSGVSRVGAEADCDLFNGISGIGHFFLRLADSVNTSSMVLPILKEIKNDVQPPEIFNDSFLIDLIYKKTFPNVSLSLDKIDFFNEPIYRRDVIIKRVEEVVKKKEDVTLNNSVNLDLLRIKIADNIISNNFFYIKNIIEKNRFQEHVFDKSRLAELFKMELCLNSTVDINTQVYPSHTSYIALRISPDGEPINQYTISEFLFDLLTTYREKATIESSYKKMIEKYFSLNQSAVNFTTNYKNQLKMYLSNGLLVVDKDS